MLWDFRVYGVRGEIRGSGFWIFRFTGPCGIHSVALGGIQPHTVQVLSCLVQKMGFRMV